MKTNDENAQNLLLLIEKELDSMILKLKKINENISFHTGNVIKLKKVSLR